MLARPRRNVLALALTVVLAALALGCTSGDPSPGSPSPTAAAPTTVPNASPTPSPTTRAPFILVTPTASPTPDLTRSRGVVDEVIAAVTTGDIGALEALVRYQDVPCDGERSYTGPPYPDCDGSELGTLVPAAAIGVCNTVWHRHARLMVERFVDQAGALFAVLEGPGLPIEYAGGVPAQARPWDYRVIFRSAPTGEEVGAVAVIEEGAVGLLVLGCAEPGWELRALDSTVTITVAGEGFVAPTPFPTQTPAPESALAAPSGTRIGLVGIDRVLEAIEQHDQEAVKALLQATLRMCTFAPDFGSTRCEDDEVEGDVVEVFPSGGGCHGSLIRPDFDAIATAMTSADAELYAVGRYPYDPGRHTLLYQSAVDDRGGFAVSVRDGAIVGRGDYSCSTPAERAGWHHVILRGPAWPADPPPAE